MKIGNITDATKILLLAAATIITCVIVWLGFSAMNLGKDLSRNAIQQMSELNNELKDSGIMKYDANSNIQGCEVVNFIKQYLGKYEVSETGPIYVSVLQKGVEYIYTNGAYESKIRDFTDSHYIDPVADFSGKVIRDVNNVIIGVQFIRQ